MKPRKLSLIKLCLVLNMTLISSNNLIEEIVKAILQRLMILMNISRLWIYYNRYFHLDILPLYLCLLKLLYKFLCRSRPNGKNSKSLCLLHIYKLCYYKDNQLILHPLEHRFIEPIVYMVIYQNKFNWCSRTYCIIKLYRCQLYYDIVICYSITYCWHHLNQIETD